MKASFLLLLTGLCVPQLYAQTWTGTTVPTNMGDYNTYTNFVTSSWGAHHAILFNALPRSPQNDGNFFDNANILHRYDVGPYGSGAAAITFLGNGGRMDFLVSGPSTGANTGVAWSPAITIARNNLVGFSNINPQFGMHVVGKNPNSNQMTLGSITTGNFAITDAGGGPYGLYAGVSGTGRAWLQAGRTDSNVAYDLVLQASGANVLIGKASQTNANYRLDVNGSSRMNEVVVNTTGADFVFNPAYHLRPLSEVESFILENRRLPEIESADEMQEKGMEVGKMETKLLQKVEELTLYLIDLKKEVDVLRTENKILSDKLNKK